MTIKKQAASIACGIIAALMFSAFVICTDVNATEVTQAQQINAAQCYVYTAAAGYPDEVVQQYKFIARSGGDRAGVTYYLGYAAGVVDGSIPLIMQKGVSHAEARAIVGKVYAETYCRNALTS
jgi:ABC-type Fe3+-hydroxamate transport system substrate-binding protein